MGVSVKEWSNLKNYDKLKDKLSLSLSSNIRYHWTCKPLEFKNVSVKNQGSPDYKPLGLWYSFGRTWFEFLEEESEHYFWSLKHIDDFKYVYEIKILPSKILFLITKSDFSNFVSKYGHVIPSSGPKHNYLINYEHVAKDYCGIEINVNKSWMDDHLWFRNWDIASGCIWNKNAIKKITLVKEF